MFIFFFLLVLIMYAPMSIYVGYRLWQTWKHFFPGFSTAIYVIVFIFFSCLLFFYLIIGRRMLAHQVSEVVTTVGLCWLVAIIYLFAVLIIFDLFRLGCGFFHISQPYFLSVPFTGLFTVIFVVGLLIYGTWHARQVQITPYNLTINKEAGSLEELNIILVSDLHLNTIMHNGCLKEMVEKINALNPDLVLMSGDLIEDTLVFLEQKMTDTLKELKARYGVFVAFGNHEYYGGSLDVIEEKFKEIGFHVLRDSYIKVADSFYVVGREDSAAGLLGLERKDLSRVMSGVDKTFPIILLDHQPVALQEAQREGVDLQVSGHTHKGQAFPANLITARLFEKDYGYLKKGNFHLIVTSGCGFWGPPIRIGSKSEIVQITVSFVNDA